MSMHGMRRFGWGLRRGLAALTLVVLLPAAAAAGIKVVETEDVTLELGLRMQPRMEYERFAGPGGHTENQRDFLIRRTRLKATGKMNGASFAFEWKIDGTDRVGASPAASVENAYVQYPLGKAIELRAGLYDLPFSRDLLTSDSKQLAVDRGDASGVPSALGLVDNGVGVQLMGKVQGGRAEYTIGLFDNRTIPGRLQGTPMIAGRLDLNLGSTRDVLRDAHFGTDSWYSIGVNGSYQTIEREAASDSFTYSALGVDGMIDVPTRAGRLFLRSELNLVRVDPRGLAESIDTPVWMVGAGLLVLDQRLQPFVRYDQTRFDDLLGGGTKDVTYVGANFYKKGHGLKFQADLRMQGDTGQALDGARLQAQMDF